MVRQTVLYMPSTPLNLLISIAHALAFSDQQRSVLLMIDQQDLDDHPYLKSLQDWAESPFEYVEVMAGKSNGKNKLKERKANFIRLQQLVDEYDFDVVAVGSDRRIEFQYVMHLLKQKQDKSVEGWYLDDGLYSYAGKPSRWYKDLENMLAKKLTYGFWWQEPSTVGASDWITKAWLFDVEKAIPELKNKTTVKIESRWFSHPAIKTFQTLLFVRYGLSEDKLAELEKAELCILIPHPNNIDKIPDYRERLEKLLTSSSRSNRKVVAKYHPRTQESDPLSLIEKFGVQLIPSSIAFEFVLMLFDNKILLVGDVGTSLLTAKWLRPEIKSIAVLNVDSVFESQMASLMKQHGIRVETSMAELIEDRYASE